MRVVMAAAEMTPLAQTGGLGEVVAALPAALRGLGIDVAVVIPGYRQALATSQAMPTGIRLVVPVSTKLVEAELYRASAPDGTPVFLIRADQYFDRDGLYGTPIGDYEDNAERFAFFARAVLGSLAAIGVPDVLHCHDWQTALAPAFLRADAQRYPGLARVRTVLTIHNLGYQGVFWGLDWHLLGLDPTYFSAAFFEFHGKINYLKGGIVFADGITTVSRTYAEEIRTPAFGCGLDGIIAERRQALTGILNGVDYTEWSPDTDPHLPVRYSADDLRGKTECKTALQRECGLPQSSATPLVGMVTRLAMQKGIDLVLAAAPRLFRRKLQLVLLGRGDARYEDACRALARRYPDRVAVRIGFDIPLAHRIEGGADLFVVPSVYEPCGLNQIYSLRYGTIPVVRATGGLDDTVEEFNPKTRMGTGFKYREQTPVEFLAAIDRARACYGRKRLWTHLMRSAMQAEFSWNRSAQEYVRLYDQLGRVAYASGDLTPRTTTRSHRSSPRWD